MKFIALIATLCASVSMALPATTEPSRPVLECAFPSRFKSWDTNLNNAWTDIRAAVTVLNGIEMKRTYTDDTKTLVYFKGPNVTPFPDVSGAAARLIVCGIIRNFIPEASCRNVIC
jgi:hypothetical protein